MKPSLVFSIVLASLVIAPKLAPADDAGAATTDAGSTTEDAGAAAEDVVA